MSTVNTWFQNQILLFQLMSTLSCTNLQNPSWYSDKWVMAYSTFIGTPLCAICVLYSLLGVVNPHNSFYLTSNWIVWFHMLTNSILRIPVICVKRKRSAEPTTEEKKPKSAFTSKLSGFAFEGNWKIFSSHSLLNILINTVAVNIVTFLW